MITLINYIFSLYPKREMELARQLRNSEFKNESIEYVMELIKTKRPLDNAARF